MGGGTRSKRPVYTSTNRKETRSLEEYTGLQKEKSKRNVFISFHMEDEYAKELLGAQARSDRFDLEFNNYAVDEPFDEKWRSQCSERISMCSKFVVLIGPDTYSREAVLWEINEAYRQGKEVIGVRIHRYKKHKIPQPLVDNGAKIIKWNIDDLNEWINKD